MAVRENYVSVVSNEIFIICRLNLKVPYARTTVALARICMNLWVHLSKHIPAVNQAA